jgi:hypothetical protein
VLSFSCDAATASRIAAADAGVDLLAFSHFVENQMVDSTRELMFTLQVLMVVSPILYAPKLERGFPFVYTDSGNH